MAKDRRPGRSPRSDDVNSTGPRAARPADLREGYPAGARYDFAWPFDYPYGPPPRYAESDGTPFTDEERAMPIDELRRKIAEPQE